MKQPNKRLIETCISLSTASGETLRVYSCGAKDGLLVSIEQPGDLTGEGVSIRIGTNQSAAMLKFLKQALEGEDNG